MSWNKIVLEGDAPAAHAASHGSGQGDEVTITEAQISDLSHDAALIQGKDVDTGARADDTILVYKIGVDDYVHEAKGTPSAHASTHEDGGADEISVASLSGLLGDAQTPLTHATSHKSGQADVILLHEFGVPTAAVNMNDQQVTGHILEKVASLPGGVDAKIVFLETDDHPYVYVA